MLAENLSYALVQVLHNFGAAGVIAVPLFALATGQAWMEQRRRLLWLALLAWLVQSLSGSGFGAVSYSFYERLPDLTGVALVALGIKITSTLIAIALTIVALRTRTQHSAAFYRHSWQTLAGLGILALTAAAFLRWFS
ncbi:MAG: hypothetical protein RQ736_11815 [Thiogranum sp.]|nr:hypothetical protein [Thiogranum sp.]